MPNPQLVDQIRARITESSETQINQLIEEARQEAFAEAKAIIKDQILQAILRGAIQEAQQMGQNVATAPSAARQHVQQSPPLTQPAPQHMTAQASVPTAANPLMAMHGEAAYDFS